MVTVLAGRRPDPVDSPYRRFPMENAIAVRERVRSVMIDLQPRVYVSSAACGADLLGQDVARNLDVDSYVVLPYEADRFRKTSVVDRPGHWGELYDRIITEAKKEGNLINLKIDDEKPFIRASKKMLYMCKRMLKDDEYLKGIVVWDVNQKEENDITSIMKQDIIESGEKIKEIDTSL